MQWFMPTTSELRDRIEQMYRLDAALTKMKAVAADVENINQRIETDLSPSKVQHEMRLRTLEQWQLIERLEAQGQAIGALQAALAQRTEENNQLRQDLTALKNLMTTKYDVIQLQIDELHEQKSAAAAQSEEQTAEIEVLQKLLETIQDQQAQQADEPKLIDGLRAELEKLRADLNAKNEEINQLWQLFAERVEELTSKDNALVERLDAQEVVMSEMLTQIDQLVNRAERRRK